MDQRSANFIALLTREVHNPVCEVCVFGPVFPAQTMRQREGRIVRLQIPH